jgi:hypothetical protein
MQAARAAADPFAEHVEFMKALYAQYQKKDEADNVGYVEALLAETQATCSRRESAVKDIIRGAKHAECPVNGMRATCQ